MIDDEMLPPLQLRRWRHIAQLVLSLVHFR